MFVQLSTSMDTAGRQRTHGCDCGRERLDFSLLGCSVLEAGQEVLRVELVELGDCVQQDSKEPSDTLVP